MLAALDTPLADAPCDPLALPVEGWVYLGADQSNIVSVEALLNGVSIGSTTQLTVRADVNATHALPPTAATAFRFFGYAAQPKFGGAGRFAVLVHHDRSIRLDRERPPREGNPRRGPADDLNIARPRLRRAATPPDADAHCPRLRRQRDGALGQHAEHSKRDESADRYHHKTLKAGERGSMRGGDDSDRSAGGQSRFGQEKQSKTSSVR